MVIRDPWYDFGTNPAFPGQANQAFQDTMGANLQSMGVHWVRLAFHIPFTYTGVLESNVVNEIAKNDYFINEVAPRNNLKVLALLDFSLVQADPRELNCVSAGCQVAGSKFGGGVNKYMDAWLTRAMLIADRYRDKISAYEVLNEENRLASDSSAIAPSIMGRLETKFYRFCKNIDNSNGAQQFCSTNTKIILGGIHPRGTGNGATPNPSDVVYLQQIYADQSSFGDFKTAHGFYPVDGIAYHPYPQEIRLSIQDIRVNTGMNRMRAALNAVDPNQQFWITEVGYNTGFDPDGAKNPIPVQTDAGQVAFMRDVYTSLSQRPLLANGQPEVATIFWFKYEDFPGTPAQHWGVVQIPFTTGNCPGGACYDLNGKPSLYRGSFLAYRELAGLPLERVLLPLSRR